MRPIESEKIQEKIDDFVKKEIFIHMETSTGSYVGVQTPDTIPACAYIRNEIIQFTEGKIVENEAWYSVGLTMVGFMLKDLQIGKCMKKIHYY